MEISGIGLGLAALGRPGYINLGHAEDLGGDYSEAAMEERAHRVLDEAYQGGIRYFDAARSYGKAEQFLSTWLKKRGLSPGEVIVGSKWGYRYTAGWRVEADKHEVKEHSLEHFRSQLPESRALLGGHLALYQIHSATLESNVLDDARVLRALAELKSQGVAIGFTTTGERQRATIEHGLRVRVDGVRLFDSVQVTYNLLERSSEPAMRAAREEGLTIIVKEALANGRLSPRGTLHPALKREMARLGSTADAVALAFALQRPFVDVVLSGAATIEQLRSNLNAGSLAKVRELEELIEAPAIYWQRRAALAWN
jgi:aryl-alcohol dehydrogenase-like predicted oxidoreductase